MLFRNWELGPEPTLGTGEEDEIIQIETDAIPREISRTNNDPKNEIETKGAIGGMPNIRKSSSNQNDQEDLLNSEDESSDDETGIPLKEENEARKLREKDDVEELTERRSNDLKKRIEKVAEIKVLSNEIPNNIKEVCNNALRGMDKAFIAGVLRTPTGDAREDSKEYAQKKTHKRRREAAFEALGHLNEAKKKIKILKAEEYKKMRLFLKSDDDTFVLTKTTLTYMNAVAVETMKEARILYKSQENLGAIQRTSSKTMQTDSKVRFAKDPAKDNTVPSAPFQEDLTF